MRFESRLAIRHLVSGGGQTALTVAAVAIAVTVIIFIQTLITGVQRRLLDDLVGALPHITIKRPDPTPDTLAEAAARPGAPPLPAAATAAGRAAAGDRPPLLATAREKQVQQRTDIEQWQRVERQLAQFPGVTTVSSAVRGNAFLLRGAKRLGVTVSGGDPAAQERVVGLQNDMIAGTWLDIGPQDVVIGWRLAEEAGVKLGDRVTLQSPEGVSASYRVAGLFDTGNNTNDLGQAFLTLRAAQSLFATRQDVSSILVKLKDPFAANDVADAMAASLPFEAESWMREQAFILNALRAQNQSSFLISAFALLASAFGIASVLIVAVIQKSKEIGILKSMGARDRQILIVFTLEGLVISVLGSLVGSGLGFLLLNALAQIPQAARFGKSDRLFNIIYDPSIFLGACGAAILATLIASILPARRAARMNPVDVIRGG